MHTAHQTKQDIKTDKIVHWMDYGIRHTILDSAFFMKTIWQNAVSIFYIRPETLYHLWGEGR